MSKIDMRRFGFDEANINVDRQGESVCVNTGTPGNPGGSVTVTSGGTSLGGDNISIEQSSPFFVMTRKTPFPASLLPAAISAPAEMVWPPFMEMLPELTPTIKAAAAVAAITAAAKSV